MSKKAKWILLIVILALITALGFTISNISAKKKARAEELALLPKKLIVEDGDTIDLDYDGYIDGQAFDAGTTNGYGIKLTIGSGDYIPGFEEQIIGHKVGEPFEITVTFPDYYTNQLLAGKEALFKVVVNEIILK